MTEEKWRKQEARIRRQPKWPIWIHIGWFFVCGVAWMKYPAIGEGWHGLVFMGVFFGGHLIIRHIHNRIIERHEQAEEERKKLGISEESD